MTNQLDGPPVMSDDSVEADFYFYIPFIKKIKNTAEHNTESVHWAVLLYK